MKGILLLAAYWACIAIAASLLAGFCDQAVRQWRRERRRARRRAHP